MNLARDPRNGRNFEYFSEDPLFERCTWRPSRSSGFRHQGVISTTKHYSLNCNETNRHWLDAVIDPDAHRESDLLAFEIAIERAQPGAVMTAYNKVNGDYAAANDVLINDVLKGAWGYRGWVMSDWGGTPSWECALERSRSGVRRPDRRDACGRRSRSLTPLRAAYADGRLPKERSVGHGAADPAVDVRRRNRSMGSRRRHRIWTRTTRLPARSHVRGSCC